MRSRNISLVVFLAGLVTSVVAIFDLSVSEENRIACRLLLNNHQSVCNDINPTLFVGMVFTIVSVSMILISALLSRRRVPLSTHSG